MKTRPRRWGGIRRRIKAGAQNALEIARLGRLGGAASEPFEIVERGANAKLRRYGGERRSAPLVLVPPLMLTAEIYDVAPDLSAVARLVAADIDCWVVDFGAPEREEGGMDRTLDDHVRAVADAIRVARSITGRDVHVAGYSQGGMFAYQAAALLRSEGIASLITFGSPVDIHRNLPAVGGDVASRMIRGVRPLVDVPLKRIRGLPGRLSSTGFRLLTPRKEARQLIDFVRELHDRSALEKRATRRRFLAGEGFVAWPGPALQRFFDDIIVGNRMMAGGLVIDGRTVSLADIRCPILFCLGTRDDFARPASIRAIRRAAPHAESLELALPAGHFGLVVGSTSLRLTWPSVIEWVKWRDGDGARPPALEPETVVAAVAEEPDEGFEVDFDYNLLTDEAAAAVRGAWRRLGNAYKDASDTLHGLRHQVPRLRQLERMRGSTRTSASAWLAENAAKNGEQTFFLWRGRAFSYQDANRRVTGVAHGLVACGVRPGDRVGVLMATRPSLLTAVTALNRVGAVAVLLSPSLSRAELAAVLAREPVATVIVDPPHVDRLEAGFEGRRLLLGDAHVPRDGLPDGVTDMETIDPDAVDLPGWFQPDAGRARELAIIIALPSDGGPKVSRISNGRWAFSALGVASAATLTASDTVYCCLPLHHPSGILVAVGGAMVSGARLALSSGGLVPERFWTEVRRYGATVAFYAGELLRPLVEPRPEPGEHNHPLRLLAGSGMRVGLAERLHERFGVGVLELYASTERNLVLANASGTKVGALGRPIPGSATLRIARYDFDRRAFVEHDGRLVPAAVDEAGVALVAVPEHVESDRVREDAFASGDRWLVSNDVLRCDADGDYWFVDRLSNMVVTDGGPVATPRVEDALYRDATVTRAVALGRASGGHEEVVAWVVAKGPLDPSRITRLVGDTLAPHERPRSIVQVASIPMTDGFRPMKGWLRASGGTLEVLAELHYDAALQRYS